MYPEGFVPNFLLGDFVVTPLKKSSAVEKEMFAMQKESNKPRFNNSKDISLLVDNHRESVNCIISCLHGKETVGNMETSR